MLVIAVVVLLAALRIRPGRRPRSPVPGMIIGLAGLMLRLHVREGQGRSAGVRRRSDECRRSRCRLAATGQCRTEAVLINRIYRTTGRSSHRYVVLGLADGSRLTV